MELEEMKTLWEEMSVKLASQQQLTEGLVLKMTQTRHREKVNKILIAEKIAAVICAIQLIYLAMNFHKLDTWYFIVCGLFTGITLLIMATLSLRITAKLGTIDILKNTYKESLLEYSKRKIKFIAFQKLNFFLGFLLMLTTIPVAGKLFGVDFFKETKLFLFYTIGFIFYSLLATWVLRKYIKMANDAENIIKELED